MRSYLILLALLCALAGVTFIATAPVKSEAQGTGERINGYAWSDTIGWISFNCLNHGTCGTSTYYMAIATDGTISGYAWSDNVGWISANASDLTGCPSAPCTATVSSGTLTGWFKVLSGGSSQSGGWDGFIKLSGTSPSFGVTTSLGSFSGYAWGDTNLGWINFSYATTTYGTDMCDNLAGDQIAIPDGYIQSGASCINYCTPTSYCDGYDLYQNTIVNHACTASFVQTCSYQCSAGACVIPPPPTGTLNGDGGALQVRPQIVAPGNKARVYWSVENVVASSCSVVGSNGDRWDDLTTSGSSGKQTSAITRQTIYTLTCTGIDSSTFTATSTVNILPIFQEN